MVKISQMSDPSVVITQVNPNDPIVLSTKSDKDNDTDFISEGGKKPTRRRGCLSTILCCFGAQKKKQHESQLTVSNNETPIRGNCLLPAKNPLDTHKKCVVIDLDETLVHSSFKPIDNADFVVPIEIEQTVHQVYVLKRPHVDEFLKKMGEMFECVLFTASLAKYADPVADLLDKWGVFKARLFRDSCVFHRGNYVKDLGRLGRDLKDVIIIDNSPASYIFHPENAVPVKSWFDDMSDTELLDMIPLMESISSTSDIYALLKESLPPPAMAHPPPAHFQPQNTAPGQSQQNTVTLVSSNSQNSAATVGQSADNSIITSVTRNNSNSAEQDSTSEDGIAKNNKHSPPSPTIQSNNSSNINANVSPSSKQTVPSIDVTELNSTTNSPEPLPQPKHHQISNNLVQTVERSTEESSKAKAVMMSVDNSIDISTNTATMITSSNLSLGELSTNDKTAASKSSTSGAFTKTT